MNSTFQEHTIKMLRDTEDDFDVKGLLEDLSTAYNIFVEEMDASIATVKDLKEISKEVNSLTQGPECSCVLDTIPDSLIVCLVLLLESKKLRMIFR